ncbi:MAG: thiol:disulfide interchange protein DsbA/DsbL [Xanthomonadales bacterium]|nr:thiol:disulfide interchange protein DsbA/DsbL [Xanthomonadales bacterium]
MFRAILLIAALLASPVAAAQAVPTQTAGASPERFEEGRHYFRIASPVATESPGQVEVTEVFSYGCPACFQFEPVMERLREALPEGAVLRLEPASFRVDEDWPLFQRAYLTAKQLGIADKAHAAMFDAVWKDGPLRTRDRATRRPVHPSLEQVADFYAGFGVTAEQFLQAARTSGMEVRMLQGDYWVQSSGTDGTPTLIVNGKWRFTPRSAGGVDQTITLMQYLVARELAAD